MLPGVASSSNPLPVRLFSLHFLLPTNITSRFFQLTLLASAWLLLRILSRLSVAEDVLLVLVAPVDARDKSGGKDAFFLFEDRGVLWTLSALSNSGRKKADWVSKSWALVRLSGSITRQERMKAELSGERWLGTGGGSLVVATWNNAARLLLYSDQGGLPVATIHSPNHAISNHHLTAMRWRICAYPFQW
jgi:hypothetical protein